MQVLAAASLLAVARIAPLRAQTSSYVTTLGTDTLAFEQFRRHGDTITGDWVTLYGGIVYHHYSFVVRDDGRVSRYALALHRASGKPEDSVELLLDDDSITVKSDGNSVPPGRIGRHVDVPIFANTIALLQAATLRARRLGDSTVIPIANAFNPRVRAGLPVVFRGDSAWLGNPAAPLWAWFDRAGQIQRLSARATTTRSEVVRVPDFDLSSVVSRFSNIADDVPIRGVLAISPRDTARGRVGDAMVTVDYGRPSVRGRVVFSRGVLGDTVWRVGANAATQLTTTGDILVGGQRLQAGTYSMWIRVPRDNSSYSLVLNSQSGQWGTEHHFDRDLLTVPLVTGTLAKPVELLTIAIDSLAAGQALHVRWAGRELSVPLARVP